MKHRTFQGARNGGVSIEQIAAVLREEILDAVEDEHQAEGIFGELLFHVLCAHVETLDLASPLFLSRPRQRARRPGVRL